MKRFFLPLTMAALCSLPEASATSADFVQAELTMKPSDAQVEQVVPKTEYFASKEAAKSINPAWHYVRIPFKLQGKCRDAEKSPLYVDELKVHAYLVFSVGKEEKNLILVDKEVTYVDIPLRPRSGSGVSENDKVQAGFFISPADATRISADASNRADKADLSGMLAAVAVEFKYKDADCSKPDTDTDVLVNKKLKNVLKKGWWTKQAKNSIGVKLRGIYETPFAPFYAPAFPPTRPLYGEDAGYSSSSPSSMGGSGYTPVPTSDTTADTTTEEPVAPVKKSRKRRK